jgi:acyl-CoA synthetase (NDP forming)
LTVTGAEAGVDLRRLLHPTSVAVVGATDRPGSYAAQALLNLETVGFEGDVWGVNPRRDEVLGHPCVPSVTDLPVAVDALIVAIPAAGVAEALEQAGARGCGSAVVFSAGFGEVESGQARQRELVAACTRHGLPVCGPNCNGIVSPGGRIALWGDALEAREAGSVALVSQSGNVAVNALATRRGLRFHTVIASGNQAVLTAADYLESLAHEDGIRSVALYLEDDGGPRLCDGLAACAEAGLPVVVLKVGSSRAGARAAAAHSAALAGDQRVFRQLVAEAGGVWAEDVHDLLELAKTIAVPGRARGSGPGSALGSGPGSALGSGPGALGSGPGCGSGAAASEAAGLAIMTCSGGDSAQGADEAERTGVILPALAPETAARLRELLPSAATVANPLDYTAMIWGDREALAEIVRALGDDPAIGQVLVFYDQPHGLTGPAEESWRAVREAVMAGAALSAVPTLVSSTLPELLDDAAAWEFACAGVAAAAGLRTGLRCAAVALSQRAPVDPQRLRAIAATARAIRAEGGRAGGAWLAEHEAKALLREAGVSVPDGRIVNSEEDALAGFAELGTGQTPVALKLSAASVQHKTELGGVILNLQSEAELIATYRTLADRAAQLGAEVLIEQMAPRGVELIVAARTDGVVPALVLGLGGIWTELLDDVAIVSLPADADLIEAALGSLRGAGLLLGGSGGRGGPGVDLGAAARLAEGLGRVLVESGLAEIECNPVLVGPPGGGAVAVDATARWRRV